MLSVAFLRADTMASEGTRGLSTYLGFLTGPASTNRRYRENERVRERVHPTEREREGERNAEETEGKQRESSHRINMFQMALEMRGSGVLVGQA